MQLDEKVLESYIVHGNVSVVASIFSLSKTYVEHVVNKFKQPNSGIEILEYFQEFAED